MLPAAIGVEIKGEINRARSVTELPKLIGAEMVPQCTGKVMKSCLAQHEVFEQSFDDDYLRSVLNSVPGVYAALGAGQKAMGKRVSKATAIEIDHTPALGAGENDASVEGVAPERVEQANTP